MNKLRFYRDDDNAPRAVGNDDGSSVLAQLLESDIQDDAVTCRELLERVQGITRSDATVRHTGNSFSVTLTRDVATFRNQSRNDEEKYSLDTGKVEQALKNWLDFIT